MQQRLRLTVQYDGTRFHGWQKMPGVSTIQGELEVALGTVMRAPVEAEAAGRTDAGVHAEGQVVSVTAPSPLDALMIRKVLRGANALLPPDIVVRDVVAAAPDFHARVCAIGKRYVYRIHNIRTPPLFTRRWRWHVGDVLDVEAMQRAAYALLGEHEFDSFRSSGCQARHARRYLWRASVERAGDDVTIELRGNAFVRSQVRVTVGTLVEIGLGKRAERNIAELLTAKDRTLAGKTAPPDGLSLARVYYPEDVLEAELPRDARFPGWPEPKGFVASSEEED